MEARQEKWRGGQRRNTCRGREVSRREPRRGPKTPASLEHGLCGGGMGQPGRSGRDLTPRAMGSHGRQEQRQIHCVLLIPHFPAPGSRPGSRDHFWPAGSETSPFQADASKTQGRPAGLLLPQGC